MVNVFSFFSRIGPDLSGCPEDCTGKRLLGCLYSPSPDPLPVRIVVSGYSTFDLTFVRGYGYTRRHQMSPAGKRDGLSVDDLVAVGAYFGLDRDGRTVIQEVADALSGWQVD